MVSGVIALVPMKAHSERVPNKNVRSFNGRPLFHWILGTLNAAETVEDVVVNTDSDKIADEAASIFGATVIERPEELRGDEVSMNRIILHDVASTGGSLYVQTHATNPLLRPTTVDRAVVAFHNHEGDSLFSVTPLRTRLWSAATEPINHERDQLLPTQELEPVYEENSNLYVFSQSSIEQRRNRIGDHPTMFTMDRRESMDIDVPLDFEIAEHLHRNRYGNHPSIAEVVKQ